MKERSCEILKQRFSVASYMRFITLYDKVTGKSRHGSEIEYVLTSDNRYSSFRERKPKISNMLVALVLI